MEKIKKLYTTPSRPGAFSGLSGFLKANKNIKKKQAISYLKTSEAYSLHKPKRKKFIRKNVVVNGIDDTWQIDLLDVTKIKDENNNYKFILTCIDAFSKYAWAIPIINKEATTVLTAFQIILKNSGRKPFKIQADDGSEFFNKKFKDFCLKSSIKLYSTFSEIKASIVERFNRTLREKMQRYFTHTDQNRYLDVLYDIVQSYNKSFHSSIRQSPVSVTKKDEGKIFLNLYNYQKQIGPKNFLKFKFTKGDKVRISKSKKIFEKGYTPNWTIEYFIIDRLIPSTPPTYSLKDLLDEKIEGIFYESELQKVEQTSEVYRIEKILDSKIQKKRKFVLVKWLGWPDKFNSWEPEENFKK